MSDNKLSVRLLTSPNCPHCASVKSALERLKDEALIGTMEIIDISQDSALADEFAVRSVPWFQLGELIFTGAYSIDELREWIKKASQPEGIKDYLYQLLENGQLNQALDFLHHYPDYLGQILPPLSVVDTPMQVKLGIGAVIESFAAQPALQKLLPLLSQLLKHDDYRVRGDACHFITLATGEEARSLLQRCLHDPHAEVREIAEEGLQLSEPGK